MPEPITLIVPYYNQPNTLARRLEHWEHLCLDMPNIHLLLVDDGSRGMEAINVINETQPNLSNLSLYRIKEDIEWNDMGAKNLGFKQCETRWVLSTDLDHTLPLESWSMLTSESLNPNRHYTIDRYNHNSMSMNTHWATFVVTVDSFWEAGGFDEDFIGFRGGDTEFRGLLERTCPSKHLDDVWCVCEEDVGDATVPFRQIQEDRKKRMELNRHKAEINEVYPEDWIRFDWERIL